MSIQFRKTSIRSRKRTLGLAAIGLIAEAVLSHPRVDVKGMVNVAMNSRFAAAPLMASLGSLTRTPSSVTATNTVTFTPVVDTERMGWNCAHARRIDG